MDVQFGTNLQVKDIRKEEKIGQGAFSKVFRGKCFGVSVAIKELALKNEKQVKGAREEIEILTKLGHPNIVLCLGCALHHNYLYIVNELCPFGSLEDLIDDKSFEISELMKIRFARDIARGMMALHGQNILHRDLKTSNLLVTGDYSVKISDFGLSQFKPLDSDTIYEGANHRGTFAFLAPEVLRNEPFNEKIDVYSFALVLWEILTRKPVFDHFTEGRLLKEVVHEGKRPKLPRGLLPRLSALIEQCWHDDANERPGFDEILPQLNVLHVETAVEDPTGQEVWLCDELIDKDHVSWDKFETVLVKVLQRYGYKYQTNERIRAKVDEVTKDDHEGHLQSARRMFQAENAGGSPGLGGHHVVRIQDWGRLLHYYGPIHKRGAPAKEFLLRPWFFGDVDHQKAPALLDGRRVGTYMVRLSGSLGWFTISKMEKGRYVTHQRITRTADGKFQLFKDDDGHQLTADSLVDFIELAAPRLGLKYPCPGSPFSTGLQWGYLRSSIDQPMAPSPMSLNESLEGGESESDE